MSEKSLKNVIENKNLKQKQASLKNFIEMEISKTFYGKQNSLRKILLSRIHFLKYFVFPISN